LDEAKRGLIAKFLKEFKKIATEGREIDFISLGKTWRNGGEKK